MRKEALESVRSPPWGGSIDGRVVRGGAKLADAGMVSREEREVRGEREVREEREEHEVREEHEDADRLLMDLLACCAIVSKMPPRRSNCVITCGNSPTATVSPLCFAGLRETHRAFARMPNASGSPACKRPVWGSVCSVHLKHGDRRYRQNIPAPGSSDGCPLALQRTESRRHTLNARV